MLVTWDGITKSVFKWQYIVTSWPSNGQGTIAAIHGHTMLAGVVVMTMTAPL
jgi:hypothetical protein